MNTVILRTMTPFLMTLLLLSSLFLVVRGHNDPGGGFAGGLLAASAFAVHSLVHGVSASQRLLRIDSKKLIGAGLFAAGSSGLLSLAQGEPFLTARWWNHWGTPLVFDGGVYLVVVGVTLTIIFTLGEDQE